MSRLSSHRLTFSEELGDVLTEHALKNASIKEQYLALASVVYEGCGPDRKSALSMCRRGLTHRAAELMEQSQSVTDGLCGGSQVLDQVRITVMHPGALQGTLGLMEGHDLFI